MADKVLTSADFPGFKPITWAEAYEKSMALITKADAAHEKYLEEDAKEYAVPLIVSELFDPPLTSMDPEQLAIELLDVYSSIAIHIAMAKGDDAEHERLCDLPEMSLVERGLPWDAMKRCQKASGDLYDLIRATDPGYAALLTAYNQECNKTSQVQTELWRLRRENEKLQARLTEAQNGDSVFTK